MKNFLFLILFSLTSLLFSGCEKRGVHFHPKDTTLGSTYNNSPDWVDESSSLADQGLSLRSSDSFRGMDVNAFANKNPQSSVNFAFDRYNLEQNQRQKLTNVAKILDNDPLAGLLIIGHCDYKGTQQYNLSLGQKRAISVESYLKSIGVPSDRVRAISKGSLNAKPNASPEECAHDRRVDIIVMR